MHFSGKDTLQGMNGVGGAGVGRWVGDSLHPFKTKNNLENLKKNKY